MTFSLYIHWPFCLSKCPYCDFNSHVRASIDIKAWEDAYLKTLDHLYHMTKGRKLRSIFFGGGTPSLMPPSLVEAILRACDNHWGLGDIEITLEANPNSVEVSNFQSLANAGINRVSIGIQSLVEEDLKALGRKHSVKEGIQAIETAQSVFSRVSFDLIYAREGQLALDWENELKQAIAFGTKHLSLYQLTIEPGTAFASREARGDLSLPNEEEATLLYEMTQDITKAHDLRAYEVSNHAHPGEESQHNLCYWRYQDYAGIGPGAHGRLHINTTRFATVQHKAPETWLHHTTLDPEKAYKEMTPLILEEQEQEAVLMGLRLTEGIVIDELPHLGQTINFQALEDLKEMGYLEQNDLRLTATPSGRLRLNGVIAKLLS